MFSKHREKWLAGLLAFILTVLQVCGWQFSMKYGTSIHHSDFFTNIGMLSIPQCMIWGIIEWGLLGMLIYWGFRKLDKLNAGADAATYKEAKHLWLYVGMALFGVYVLCLVGCYPGFYCYDMGNQLPQFMYEEVSYNAHHPLLHTIVGGAIISLGYHIYSADLTFGVFLYNLAQMGLCAFSFGYAVRFVYRISHKRALAVFSALFYALCPPIVLFAMTTTKDVSCYAVLLLAGLKQYELCRDLVRQKEVTKAQWICAGALLVLSCLLRKNIVYAFVVYSVIAVVLFRKYLRKLLVFYLCTLFLFLGIHNGMIVCLGAAKSSAAEALSIPFQQLARLYADKGEAAFPGEDLELLYAAIDPELLSYYDPIIADPIKTAFWYNLDTILENKWTYLAFWLRKGWENPLTYVASFAENTYQAWYPWTELMDTHNYRFFDITDWIREYSRPFCRPLYDFFMAVTEGKYRSFPVLRLFCSTGTMFWALLVGIFYGFWRKNRLAMTVLLLQLLVCATSMCGPVSDLRYYLNIFYLLPVVLGYLFYRKENDEITIE